MAEEKEKNESDGDMQTVRTFESDAAEYIKKTGQSRASIALAESERKNEEKNRFKFEEKKFDREKAKFVLTVSGILVLAGAIIFLAFVLLKPEGPPEMTYVKGQPIIIIDQEKIIDLAALPDDKALEKISTTVRSGTVGVGAILSFKIVRTSPEEIKEIDTEEFFKLVAKFAPNKLVRSLEDKYALGLLGFDGSQPFLIFKTDSFENAYSGMLEWEHSVPVELKPVFERGDGWATTTPAYGPGSTSRSYFAHAVISNMDARTLPSTNGKTILIYSFPDKNTLLITTNEKTFSTLITKLRNAKLIR